MSNTLSFAVGGALVVACSGSSDVNIPQASSSSGTSGTSGTSGSSGSSGSSGTSGTSGIVCAPCEVPPPSPACTGTGPCGCAPYTCPDGGNDPKDAGSDAPSGCTWSAVVNPCGAGKYCAVGKDCGQGVCLPLGEKETTNRSPVCGCDGVTYWNESVAAKNGMSIQKTGACAADGKTCGGLAGGTGCPNGSKCNYRVANEAGCKQSDKTGTCWMIPSTCPAVVIGSKAQACDSPVCADECSLIDNGAPWFSSNICP